MGDYIEIWVNMEHVVISLPVVLFISTLQHSFIFATVIGHISQWLLVMSAKPIIFVFSIRTDVIVYL